MNPILHQLFTIETPRLWLRQWSMKSDLLPFAQLNSDPHVMQYFPKLLAQAESDALAERMAHLIELHGWGIWAVELKNSGQFIGCCGLHAQPEKFCFSPCVEIGWRFAQTYWGQGYALEAAQAALNFAFEQLNLQRVVAFTAIGNERSEKLMQRLGMSKQFTFKHPDLSEHSTLKQHVLYQITRI